MAETAGAVPSARGDVVRRWVVTVAAVVAYWAIACVQLPFVRLEPARHSLYAMLTYRTLSLRELGLTPIVGGFLAVEIVALAIPALRRRRNGTAEERAGLTQAAWFVAIAIAAVQAAAVVHFLQGQYGFYGEDILPGAGRMELTAVALTLVAATAFVGLLARAVGRHGLGNGLAVLVTAALVGQLADHIVRELHRTTGAGRGLGLLWLFLAAGAMILVVRALRAGSQDLVRVPLPTCGLVPLALTTWIVSLPQWLGLGLRFRGTDSLLDLLEPYGWPGRWAIAMAFGLLFALLFTPRARVRAAWSAARLAAQPAPEAVDGTLRAAHRWSLLLVAAVAAVPLVGGFLKATFTLGHLWTFELAAVITVVMDLAAEARARRGFGPLVPVFPLHRVYAVEPALAALGQAGIPAVARARYFRALFQFFAPFSPIELLVPPERAEEAARICAPIACPEASPSAGATPPEVTT
jgi:hypothetical protein